MSDTATRKTALFLGLVLGLALLAYAVWLGFSGPRRFQRTDDAYVAADYTLIAPKVAGFISEVRVEDDQHVEAGQLLAQIDDRDYRAALQAAQAEVASARAQQAHAQASLERQGSLIEQAEARVAADRAELAFAEFEVQRYRHLAGQGAGTLQNSQQAQSRFDSARAGQARDRAALDAARKQTEVLAAQRDAAEAGVQRALAAEARAELDLSHTRVVAPLAGTVGRRAVRIGAFVSPGSELMALVPLEHAYVRAHFQETQLTAVRPGQAVEIEVDGYPGEVLRGHVQSIAPATGVTFAALAPDNATGNFTKVVQRIPVKIALDAQQALLERLRVGMSVEARIDTADAGELPVAQRGELAR
ncbi:HlyD family secretion protein [Pseudomonas sp. RIT-PI-AD]|uniref:HlyD family secretion protein n=1 Tax=Pseudomonas sp. RIT-PI-AD TaxID=3035294 RepID=UPI0021D951E8|nr:HlyD family secretion protein [Pseudomonas sp. RIT-PI-AD]